MASWLHLLHHEEIFLTQGFLVTVLLSALSNIISDSTEGQFKISADDIFVVIWYSFVVLIGKGESLVESVTTSLDPHSLFNSQFHTSESDVTSGVVQVNLSLANFSWFENVFLKSSLNFWDTLVNAATSGDLILRNTWEVSLEGLVIFLDNKDLLILHVGVIVVILEWSSDVILDHSLWFGLDMLVLIVQTGWNARW